MTEDLAAALSALLGGEATDLRRLSGGASRETWSFAVAGTPLILQRQRPGVGVSSVTMATEAALLATAAQAGVPVPRVVADATDGQALGSPALVVEHLAGETIARKLLRDDDYAAVRPRVAGECGAILAAIHSMDVDAVPGLAHADPVTSMRSVLDGFDEPHPAFELALRWLDRNRPADGPTTVVHGDFRTGNLIVDPERVVAILDWELAHLGDPLEDLGWFCVRAWRFGADDRPAGGFGSREDLWRAYEAAGGRAVDPEAARWWEVYGTLRWGVICLVQAASHLLGFSRSLELALIGRRAAENEHDLLALLSPGTAPPAPTPVDEGGGAHAPHDRPTAVELAEALREWVEGDVLPATEGRLRFGARVATRALGTLARELRMGTSHAVAHDARLSRLGVGGDGDLAARIRAGDLDGRWDEVLAEVWGAVVDKLEVANPGYAAGRP